MKTYAYRAVHKETGKIQKGHISATSENELTFFLKQLDLELIEAKIRRSSSLTTLSKQMSKHTYLNDLITLCSHMHDMLNAGVTFEDAFSLCSDTVEDGPFRDALHQIAQDIRAGDFVCAAFAKHSLLFDPVFLSILEAGEISGDLSETFNRLNKHLQWQDQVSRQIKRAVRYPLFLLCLALGVVTFMLSFVLPQLIEFLSNLSHDLPWSTRILITSAEVFAHIWWTFPILIIGMIVSAVIMRRLSKDTAVLLDQAILFVPLLGDILRKLALVRLTTSLSLLVKSGLPLPIALETAKRSLGSPSLERNATQSHAQVVSGSPFSDATAILFPPYVLQMLKVGEKSGTMQATLDRIARSLETQAKESVDRFLGLLEPALTVLVGALMAWIVLAILGPVYSSLVPLSQ